MNEPLKTRKRIIRQLRDIRRRKKISYRTMERITGIKNNNISAIEKQYKNITIDTVALLAGAMGYKVELWPIDESEI